MVWRLSLRIASGMVDHIEARYSETLEAEVLERVFPKAHWTGENPEAIENPPEFDFLGNVELAREAISDYQARAGSNTHDPCWAKEFLKTYHVGEELQKVGLHPRVSIG